MYIRLGRLRRPLSWILGLFTFAGVASLFLWDLDARLFPSRAHDLLAAFPLAMIAVAYLLYVMARRPAPLEMAKAMLLAMAFLFWAANQFWPNLPQATLFNDIAIALFVLDVFLVMIGWPPSSPGESFAETCAEEEKRLGERGRLPCCGGCACVPQGFQREQS